MAREQQQSQDRVCPGQAANKGLLFVLVGAAVTVPRAGGRESIRGRARIFRYDLQSRDFISSLDFSLYSP